VHLLDRDCRMARLVLAELAVGNVTIEEGNALERGGAGQADAIIAADVLEHFRDLGPIVGKLREWLRPGGILLTCLPTENIWYQALRTVFGVTKPVDHYHTAAQVEAVLRRSGFEPRARLYHPLGVPLFPLFRVTAWRRI
jgi:2-polyprenyl-3-methyl-5-hydroxy-6-metoxy-1,4-benzoquinol methylase